MVSSFPKKLLTSSHRLHGGLIPHPCCILVSLGATPLQGPRCGSSTIPICAPLANIQLEAIMRIANRNGDTRVLVAA